MGFIEIAAAQPSIAEVRWAALPVDIDDRGMQIGNASVVEYWEAPAQALLATSVVQRGSNVLEIGYGLGMAAKAIQGAAPLSHVIVEAHPRVAEIARKSEVRARVLVGFWQRVSPTLRRHSIDAIVFDAYPTEGPTFDGSAAATWRQVLPIIPEAQRLLAKDGGLAFLDYSNRVSELSDFRRFLEASGTRSRVLTIPVMIPEECTFAQGDRASIIVLTPVA